MGEDSQERAANAFGKNNNRSAKAGPIDSMEVDLREDGTLSYTIQWLPTTFTCKSLNLLKKYEQKRLGELATAKYGSAKWADWLTSLEGEYVI